MPALIWGLMLAQALALSAAPLMVFAGGIIGSQLQPDPRFSTLPVAAMVMGTALAVLPASQLAGRIGRRPLFLTAMLFGCCAAIAAAWSVHVQSFWAFSFSALCFGAVGAVVQQFRFVAMAAVPPEQTPVVAARLLLAGILSAFLGPELTRLAIWFPQWGFAASFAGLALFFILAAAVLCWFMPQQKAPRGVPGSEPRSLDELMQQPLLWLAMLSAACAYGVMAYIMTATPLSMTREMGYELSDAKWVIQSHIAAMFLPSLISGHLIRWAGHWWMIMTGLMVMAACLIIAWFDQTILHYWLGLVLLGLGWNLLFVAGTSLLSQCYRPAEATRVQGINDLAVFGAQATGALASGAVVLLLGWQGLLLTTVPALLLLLVVLLRMPRTSLSA